MSKLELKWYRSFQTAWSNGQCLLDTQGIHCISCKTMRPSWWNWKTHILKIYFFLLFDKCCLHVEAGLHPRGTGNLQSSLCSKRLTMRIIMSFPLIFIIELFPFTACSLGGLYFVFLVGHGEYKKSRNSQ